MRGQPASSRARHPGRTGPSRGSASGPGGDPLRVVRATRDQLGVAWSAEVDPLSWQVVCWDSCDAAVARLKLSRNAPARDLRPSCSFAAAVHDRRLRPGTRWLRALAGWACRSVSAGRSPCWARGSLRLDASAQAPKYGQPRKEGGGVAEAAEEGCGARQDGQDEEAEAEEEDRAREVAAAGFDRAPSPVLGADCSGCNPAVGLGQRRAEVRVGCTNSARSARSA